MSFPVILTNIFDRSSPDFKYWSGQSSSSKKGYQTVDPHQPKKTGPKRKLTRYEEYILTLVRLHLALTKFLLGVYLEFQHQGCQKYSTHGLTK